jgi:hypothetical protein
MGQGNDRSWCHILLHPCYAEFGLVAMLTGEGGLPRQWGTHIIQVRGAGSGGKFLRTAAEESDPLKVVIRRDSDKSVADDPVTFRNTVAMTLARLKEVWEPFARERTELHNERPWTLGDMSAGAESALAEMLDETGTPLQLLTRTPSWQLLPPPLMPVGEGDAFAPAAAAALVEGAGEEGAFTPAAAAAFVEGPR